MARVGTPRLRHLRHRQLDRVERQPIVTDFVDERASTLTQYADADAVWEALKATKAETLADEVDIP